MNPVILGRTIVLGILTILLVGYGIEAWTAETPGRFGDAAVYPFWWWRIAFFAAAIATLIQACGGWKARRWEMIFIGVLTIVAGSRAMQLVALAIDRHDWTLALASLFWIQIVGAVVVGIDLRRALERI